MSDRDASPPPRAPSPLVPTTPGTADGARTFRTAEELAQTQPARAMPSTRRAWALAADLMGTDALVCQELSSSFRSVVWRFTDGCRGSSVVATFYRRRDGAVNSGGFGYLRARHGAAALPDAARLLAHDDRNRLVVCEDLRPAGSAARSLHDLAATDPEVLFRWMRDWPALVLPVPDARARAFCSALSAADPVAADSGRAGALPSIALAGVESAELVRPDHAVLWSGDLNPGNALVVPGRVPRDGATPDEVGTGTEPIGAGTERRLPWRQIDLEGTGYCDPALLVAEAEWGLPSSPDGAGLRRGLEVQGIGVGRFHEIAEDLADAWKVSAGRRAMGRRALQNILAELRPGWSGPSDSHLEAGRTPGS